jgi:glucan 1,3-beta-glucosidase
MCGVCKWHKNPAHVEFALTVLEQLTSRYRARTALWGIEVLNEPISEQLWEAIDLPRRYPPRDPEYARGSEPVPTGFLKDFYTAAYRRIRAQSDDVTIVFHDGFRIREWDKFFTSPEFERIVVDTHLYLMEYTFRTGDGNLSDYLGYVRNEFGSTVREMSQDFPLIIGEWCLEPMSASAAAMPQSERLGFYRSLADAQLAAWDSTVGWFFWSYKLLADGSNLDGWDLRTSIERGYLPGNLSREEHRNGEDNSGG